MVSLTSLWLPIVLSAVFVFVASSLIHMVLPYHRGDFAKVTAEDEMIEALRKLDLPPGDYMVPHPGSMEGMKSAAFQEKRAKGPVLVMTVMKPGAVNLGPSLLQWFLYSILVSLLAAYVTSRAVGPGTPYLQVFRFAGTTAFIGYAIALWQDSIWYKKKWSTTFRNTFDGLIYGLLTAGTFGCWWPK